MKTKLLHGFLSIIQQQGLEKVISSIKKITLLVTFIVGFVFSAIMYFEPFGGRNFKIIVVLVVFAILMFVRKIILSRLEPIFNMAQMLTSSLGLFKK